MGKKYHYPVFTEGNFERMYAKYVHYSRHHGWILKVKKPRNREEFGEMTQALFGKPIGLKNANTFMYEALEDKSLICTYPLMKLWAKKVDDYYGDAPKIAFRTAFGKVRCGGIARTYYAQFTCGYRDKLRLNKF